MNKVVCFISFVAGAAIGGVATWKYLETKTEEKIQEEIEIFKTDYIEKKENTVGEPDENIETLKKNDNEQELVQKNKEKPSIIEYAAKVREQRYQSVDYNNPSNNVPKDENVDETEEDAPYVIPPEEFGTIDGYETIALTFYADNVLADEMDDLVDVDDVIGCESLNSFGEYEDDVVYVRNDKYECDYEIAKDNRTYFEVTETMPHRNGV